MIQKKILIVEDEAITAMSMKNKLEKFGYQVVGIADSGEEALNLSETFHPDLILMDIVLNGKMDGTEAAKEISKRKIPIIFLTAYSDNDTFNRAKSSVPYGYLTKPIKLNDLRLIVEIALFKHQAEIASEKETMRIKNEFLSNMSHELRTPLNSINGFLELMSQGLLSSPADINELANNAMISMKQLIKMIDGVLELTHIESDKYQIHLEKIDLKQTINEVSHSFSQVKENKVSIKIDISDELKIVNTDLAFLKQILFNFISNAIKFSDEKNVIEINVRPEGKAFFCIEVKDSGIGIKEEEMNKLFIPFKQLDMSMSKKYQGTGFGLALTKKMVEILGGQVSAFSTFGKGSTFFAVLPLNKS